jgi:hypothetical protein
LDLGSENVRRVMKSRVNLAKSKECDGVDPDNVDAYVSTWFTVEAFEPTRLSLC